MAFVKRAAETGLALFLVTGALFGAHRFARSLHEQSVSTASFRSRTANTSSAVPGQLLVGDTALPLATSAIAECPLRPFRSDPSYGVFAKTATAVDESDTSQFESEVRTADHESSAAPRRFPTPQNTPLTPVREPDESTIGKTAPSESPEKSASTGRRIIEKELPNSSVEERELWHEMLKDLPPNDLRELLRVRERLNRISRPAVSIHHPPSQPALLPPDPRSLENDLSHAFSNDGRPSASNDGSSEAIIRETLAAIAQARRVIVENLANANTPGYKRRIASFATTRDAPKAGNRELQVHRGQAESSRHLQTTLAPSLVDASQGKLCRSGRSLDLAIDGPGFFQLTSTDASVKETFYTRCGRFTTDAKSRIVLRGLKQEWILSPSVRIPEETSEIEIGTDGVIWVIKGGDRKALDNRAQIGGIQLAFFRQDRALTPCGDNLFLASGEKRCRPGIGNPGLGGLGRLRQGCFEESNVDPQQELDELQKLQRHAQILEQAARLLRLEDSGHPGLADRPLKPAS